MSTHSKRFEAPRRLDGVSAEARELVLEASARLEDWIDENVDRIESEMQAILEARRQELAAQASAVQTELAAGRERLAEVLDRLDALQADFEVGDGMTIDEAVRTTREVVRSLRSVIDERDRQLNELVRGILSSGHEVLGRI